MSRDADRTPVVVGVAQHIERDVDPERALDPLALLELVARRAAEDAGIGDALWARLDRIAVPMILSWPLRNPARLLAERLGARPRDEIRSTVGGNMPARLANEAAREIRRGALDVALIGGAEAQASVDRATQLGVELAWPSSREPERIVVGDPKEPLRADEMAHGLTLPLFVYPLLENVRRARLGLGLEEHRERIGRLASRLSAEAACNPYAWFPKALAPDEITRVTPDNRMVVFPYTKRMNSMPGVNLGAAVILTSVSRARALGIPESRWVYWWGGGESVETPWFLSERPRIDSTAALGKAAFDALAEGGTGMDAIDFFDLYSCFPSSVGLACEALGLAEDDPRPLSVTGGLPYAGGPWNNFCTHALACLVERLRAHPGSKGLLTGIGWYLSRHAVSVYASEPPASGAPNAPSARSEASPRLAVDPEPQGRGHIEAYTVVFERDGTPRQGIVIGRLKSGKRFLANTPDDARLLEALLEEEAIGRSGNVRVGSPVNRFRPD